jgi:2Fe-2S ferredoxin
MPKVTLLPYNVTLDAEVGESILWQVLEHGYYIEHECEGSCACTTCHILVLEGEENLSEMEDDEYNRVSMAEGVTMRSRLACQARVQGDCTVQVMRYNFDKSPGLKKERAEV